MKEGNAVESFMEMGTLGRHNEIITEIVGKLFSLIEQRREIRMWHENYPLVYWGKRTEMDTLSLVDISQIEDIESFKENVMTVLRRVEPDFMLFDKNAYIELTNVLYTQNGMEVDLRYMAIKFGDKPE